MITVVDRNDTHVVQKVTKPNGVLVRYQVVINGVYDAEQVKPFVNLESARAFIGKANNGLPITQPSE